MKRYLILAAAIGILGAALASSASAFTVGSRTVCTFDVVYYGSKTICDYNVVTFVRYDEQCISGENYNVPVLYSTETISTYNGNQTDGNVLARSVSDGDVAIVTDAVKPHAKPISVVEGYDHYIWDYDNKVDLGTSCT